MKCTQHIFIKTNPKTFSGEGNMLLQKIKSHLDLHRDLKYTLPLEELHPQGSEANQVLGADALLKFFVNMYKANPKIKYDLLV